MLLHSLRSRVSHLSNYVSALFLLEAWHTWNHLLVLFGVLPFVLLPEWVRQMYFPLDLASALCSALYLWRSNTCMHGYSTYYWAMAGLHMFVHVSTVAFWHSWFFQQVFELAEYKFCGKPHWVISIYMLGTAQDIVTHCVNAYLLLHGRKVEKKST